MTDWTSQLPESLAIDPLRRPPLATVRVPGSKSITNRALILAALSHPAKGSELRGVLQSEDTEVLIDALRMLDIRVRADWPEGIVHVRRGIFGRIIPAEKADLFVANSGTSMRFLTALVSLGQGHYRIDGVSRMRERPIEDLLTALRQLGVHAACEQQNGYPPVRIEANGLDGGRVQIKGDVSSQFLSALLMAAPLARGEITIEVDGPIVSVPYIAMTVAMMRQFGVDVETDDKGYFRIPTRPWYNARSWDIEPDASAASYFFGAAAITRGEVTVTGLGNSSLQGDLRFVDVLEDMGCRVVRRPEGYTVAGGALRGIDVDMNPISDCVMTLAAVACFAKGPTTIRNVAHIRHKETDRLQALATEIRKVGPRVEEFADGLTIIPCALHGATIDTYNDHRMAMSMALVGLTIPGVVIRNPACVAKTYPRFFEDLEQLR
ncbi:MAG TPA: 3-phosphoshikimate 1-carboxyvinyltransferase [Gemmataceae bacterium]|nr:3-phosphoshikimate 1-carboxyvinyltransferase [Gemmataceae bacterium]